MGCGIIQVLAQNGFEVVFIEREKTLIDKASSSIIKNLEKMVGKGKITEDEKIKISGRIKGYTDMSALMSADIVIEAATENVEAKKEMFRQLDKKLRR